MAYDENVRARAAKADSAVAPYRLVKVGAAGREEVAVCGANERAVGVAPGATHDRDTTNAADTGDTFQVYHGEGSVLKCEAGAALATVGVLLKSDAAGRVVAAATTGTTVQEIVGILLKAAAAAGEIVEVLWMPHKTRPALV